VIEQNLKVNGEDISPVKFSPVATPDGEISAHLEVTRCGGEKGQPDANQG
jgi:hypothetical protein